MALTLLIGRLNRRWEAARAAGDAAEAGRLAGEIVAESEAYLRLVVPREDQYRAMVETATRLERWDLIVRWTERLAAVSALDPRAANNLAYAYLRTGGDLRRAETLARAAAAGRPDIPPFLYTLSEVLAAAGKREEAAQVYQRARAAEGPGGTVR
jgi:tetratricopeptide (TPR) repeat protein